MAKWFHNFRLKLAQIIRPEESQNSSWLILKYNSFEYIEMMEMAFLKGLHAQVLHNGHIAVELAFKSAYSRIHGFHRMGHHLKRQSRLLINGKKIIQEINVDPVVQIQFAQIISAWDMKDRYLSRSISKADAQNYLNAFKGVHTWTIAKYCT